MDFFNSIAPTKPLVMFEIGATYAHAKHLLYLLSDKSDHLSNWLYLNRCRHLPPKRKKQSML